MVFYDPRRFFNACSVATPLTSAACLALALCGAQPVVAQSFSNMVFFGDSGTDNGIYVPTFNAVRNNSQLLQAYSKAFGSLPSLATGIPTTTPGLMWSEALGQKFGIAIKPASSAFADYVAKILAPSLGVPSSAFTGIGSTGNNYAASGAGVATNAPDAPFAWFGKDQVAAYLASTGGVADPKALYVVLLGGNDFASIGKQLVQDTSALRDLSQQASALAISLKSAGARYILVPNIANQQSSGAVYRATHSSDPALASVSDAQLTAYYASSSASFTAYSQNVWSNLASAKVNFIPADLAGAFNYVVTHAATFGFKNVDHRTPACGQVDAADCTPANWVTPDADKTYFWTDKNFHPTTAGQKIQADYVYNLLAAPGQISLLPVAQLRGRLGVIEGVWAQMPDKARAEGERHAWISGDVAALKSGELLDAQPGKNLRPMSVAAGVDYQISPLWLAGFGASFGRSNQSFATGGSFSSDDVAASLYLGFRQEALWMNAVATAGKTNVSTQRTATLGITTETNSASPKGSGQSLALQGGYDFAAVLGSLPVTHGPVLGLVAQRAGLDGFTETNGQSGLTALQFASQWRGSTIAELGYLASLDLGGWSLFSKLILSHELQTGERTISTSLTTITAPAYALPAAALPKNWATASVGAKYAITDKLNGYASASLRSGGGGIGGFGASMGLNLAF